MGIRETDDYLTVRFANPTTGVVSPSAYGGRTPRTPLTPGEALRLFSKGSPPTHRIDSNSLHDPIKPSHDFQAAQARLCEDNRYAQPVAANSSATMSPIGAFPLTPPASGLCDPFSDAATIASQKASAIHGTQKDRHDPLHHTNVVGNGVQKFAMASKALKTCNNIQRPRLQRRITAIRHGPAASQGLKPSTARQAHYAHERQANAGAFLQAEQSSKAKTNIQGEPTSTPAGHNSASSPDSFPEEVIIIPRKPVGAPALRTQFEKAPKTSDDESEPRSPVFGCAIPCASFEYDHENDIEGPPPAAGLGPLFRTRRRIQQDHSTALVPGIGRQRRVFTLPRTEETEAHSQTLFDALLSPRCLDRILSILRLLSVPLEIIKQQCTVKTISLIVPAIAVITDYQAHPAVRMSALKTLLSSFGRTLVILTAFLMIWRVCAAIKELLDILFWPLSLIGGLSRLVCGW